jgi:hypothetical protein
LHRRNHAMRGHDLFFVGFPMTSQCHAAPPGARRVSVGAYGC